MARYEVAVDWNATSWVTVEADSAQEAEELVQQHIDGGAFDPPDWKTPELYDPEVAFGLAELVLYDPFDPALD